MRSDKLDYRDACIKCCATCRHGNEWGHPSHWQGHCEVMANIKADDVVEANFVCNKYETI